MEKSTKKITSIRDIKKPVITIGIPSLQGRNYSLNRITAWERKGNTTAWPKIERHYIADGLRSITEAYYDTNKFSDEGEVHINQGQYPVCGPAALTFYLAKEKGIDRFVDMVTTLYETGKINNWVVPARLRKFDASPEKFWGVKGPFTNEELSTCRVNWMVMSSIAQKETAFQFDPSKNNRMMFTFVTEMQRDIEFLFGVKKTNIDRITSWATTDKAISNLSIWDKYLEKGGVVVWLMHGNALGNILYGNNDPYNHAKISDLHWVIVLDAKKSGKNVTIKLFTWGTINTITISQEDFRKMSYESLEFVVDDNSSSNTTSGSTTTPPAPIPTVSRLDVTVKVADEFAAGTDYDVHFRTVTKNSSENAYLLDDKNVNDFERGSTRTYPVCLNSPIKIEDLKQFRLTCAFKIKSAKFIVSKVIVKDGINGTTLAEAGRTVIQRDSPLTISVNASELLKKYK